MGEPVSDPPESFRLPDGFASIGDPIDENPFHPDDLRHPVWRDATRTAELEVAKINLGYDAALRQVRENEQRTHKEASARIDLGAHFSLAAANEHACVVSMVAARNTRHPVRRRCQTKRPLALIIREYLDRSGLASVCASAVRPAAPVLARPTQSARRTGPPRDG